MQVDVTVTFSLATPSLATLLQYDSVLVFSDYQGFVDKIDMGDVLAEYVDNGGCLLIATFALYEPRNHLGLSSRLSSGVIFPLLQGARIKGHH